MTIDPTTLPDGAIVSFGVPGGNIATAWIYRGELREYDRGGEVYGLNDRFTFTPFVPVPEGMTYADAEAALADAGAWVEVDAAADAPKGTRIREQWTTSSIAATLRRWVHRDDLPPTDPDAELVEKMARAMCDEFHEGGWERALPNTREKFRRRARAALAVVREHEARS